jgi:hypothetical protein
LKEARSMTEQRQPERVHGANGRLGGRRLTQRSIASPPHGRGQVSATEGEDNNPEDDDRRKWSELDRIVPWDEVEHLTTLSRDTIKRTYSQHVVQLSKRRRGITLRSIRAINSQRARG